MRAWNSHENEKTDKSTNMGSRATAKHFPLILYSTNSTSETCHTFEVRYCVCLRVCVYVWVCMCVCVSKKEVKATTVGFLLSYPPTKVLEAWDSLMSMGFIASISPC